MVEIIRNSQVEGQNQHNNCEETRNIGKSASKPTLYKTIPHEYLQLSTLSSSLLPTLLLPLPLPPQSPPSSFLSILQYCYNVSEFHVCCM